MASVMASVVLSNLINCPLPEEGTAFGHFSELECNRHRRTRCRENHLLREALVMPTCKGIVGNVGSVYFGKSRADAQKTYQSYVESSKEHLGARCYGEGVTLLVDGEIEQEQSRRARSGSLSITKFCKSKLTPDSRVRQSSGCCVTTWRIPS
jgi:hypothetical protein